MNRLLISIGVSALLGGYAGQLLAADTGDAPASYGEATHEILENGPWLGDDPADDNAPVGDDSAEADDNDGFDDEGGVFAFAQLVQNGKSYLTNVFASNPGSTDATLVAWIDFDGSGVFDADEGVVLTVPAGADNEKFRARWPDLTGIASDYLGVSYARYRISTAALTVNDAQGSAPDGEVEDYKIEILRDSDGDERPDSIDPDNDNDGIPDTVEGTTGDTDGDGTNDYLDVDSDADTVPDFVEAGANPNEPVDTDGDGTPDYLDQDSNNDGINDSEPMDSDADQDGIMDDLEGSTSGEDSDGDGIANQNDIDSDNDTIPDVVERGPDASMPVDTDGDGIPDFLDLDSDNDGITDIREANTGELNVNLIDTDNNGQVDSGQVIGSNGYVDVAETSPDSGVPIFAVADSDDDGNRDYIELDSDNDGVFDLTETLGTDTDSNGLVDSTTDDNQDGVIDGSITTNNTTELPDTDGDFVPDFQDGDANGSDPLPPENGGDTGGDTGGDDPDNGDDPDDGGDPAEDDPLSNGPIQTGLSGGGGCSAYNVRQLELSRGVDPLMPLMLVLAAVVLLVQRRQRGSTSS
ncbi:MAG: hypothetical protein KTR32_03590 [Granulosicoccus sp.]|nr:hypothetical protein [Granulosicoccus sp.]